MTLLSTWHFPAVGFAKQSASLAERVGCHVNMIRRYDIDGSQCNQDIIRKLAIALGISIASGVNANALVFEQAEQGSFDCVCLQIETASALPEEVSYSSGALLHEMTTKYQAHYLVSCPSSWKKKNSRQR